MNRAGKLAAALALALPLSIDVSRATTGQELRVVPSVDLSRYAGTWYEIARLPNRFQDSCAGEVTATYRIDENGEIDVLNRCRQANGKMKSARGSARRASPSEPSSKLKVRFAPALLSFVPWVWGDYWIIGLAPDYSYAVVGDPSRKYLWILSRTPQMEEAVYRKILEEAKKQGFNISRISRTRQER